MGRDAKDDPHLPIYLQPRFNQFRTEHGWDFSGFMHRPAPLTGRAALEYVMEQHDAAHRQALRVSHAGDGFLEELVVHAFYAAGKNADDIWHLMTIYDIKEIKEGEALFVVRGDSFEIISGHNISIMQVPPLDDRFVRFESGWYRKGIYMPGRIAWEEDTHVPADGRKAVILPERLILDGCVYRIL